MNKVVKQSTILKVSIIVMGIILELITTMFTLLLVFHGESFGFNLTVLSLGTIFIACLCFFLLRLVKTINCDKEIKLF